MNSISTFDITQYPLLDILKDIKTGRIQLPDFQRDWVWDDFQVRRVLASVSLAYPIGAVMMLQQGNHQVQFKIRSSGKSRAKNPGFKEGQKKYAKQYRVSVNRWSYDRLSESIHTCAAKTGIAIEIGQQPNRGSPKEKARDLAIAAYHARITQGGLKGEFAGLDKLPKG